MQKGVRAVTAALLLLGLGVGQEPAPEAEPAPEEAAGKEAEVDEALFEQGQEIYGASCQVCHGEQGQGTIGPALAGNEELQDTDYVVRQILTGGGGMPAFRQQLDDGQVAAVATYILNAWENDFGTVAPERVEEIRGDGQ